MVLGVTDETGRDHIFQTIFISIDLRQAHYFRSTMTSKTGARLASTSLGQEIHIPVPSHGNINHSKADRSLVEGPRETYMKIGAPLFKASATCDWKAAKAILDKKPDLVRYSITETGETALHVAATIKGKKLVKEFVKNLMGRMQSLDFELVNDDCDTALCLAAASGSIETVRIMLNKMPCEGQMRPLCKAALYGNKQVVRYLYEKSNNMCDDNGWDDESRGWLLEQCVEANMFDVALEMVKIYPQLGSTGSVLQILARKPDAFHIRELYDIQKIINSVFALTGLRVGANYEKESKATQLLKIIWDDIAKKPKEEIYAILTGSPNLDEEKNIPYTFQVGAMKDLIIALKDDDGNNMLHLTAKRPKQEQHDNLSGAVSEMQRELLWFKEVKNMTPHIYRQQKNKDGLTPHELFTKEHKKLVKDGEQWTKEAINYCVVVAALIATVTFVAASTIPGGYNQDDGIPIFNKKSAFVVFVVSDAMSLILSSTSILTFLSIITSRIAELDFRESLPKKMWLGISSLFLSIAAMMVTFSASFFILYHKEMQWIPILIGVFAFLPVLLYIQLQYHIFVDVIRATYGTRYLFKPRRRSLYY
ncbi:hypothetical protein QVD17_15698 [Tagetes erecta]|uniref:PGG domain-containing protein n=1 Tax=Tagetes erecta TaxID=13708 RepID=A0AAD8KTN3_TARER|nr:hypothetical protein QVD17_15698 [Tagetes erecta]